MKKILELLSENFQFLMMKFSVYLNRRVFVMRHPFYWEWSIQRVQVEESTRHKLVNLVCYFSRRCQ